jgi:hypothetical protein
MELYKVELEIVEGLAAEVAAAQSQELADLQLAMMGNGTGDPIAF